MTMTTMQLAASPTPLSPERLRVQQFVMTREAKTAASAAHSDSEQFERDAAARADNQLPADCPFRRRTLVELADAKPGDARWRVGELDSGAQLRVARTAAAHRERAAEYRIKSAALAADAGALGLLIAACTKFLDAQGQA